MKKTKAERIKKRIEKVELKTTAERIINLVKEKREEINRNGYFTLTIKVQDGYPTIARIETSLKPAFKNDE